MEKVPQNCRLMSLFVVAQVLSNGVCLSPKSKRVKVGISIEGEAHTRGLKEPSFGTTKIFLGRSSKDDTTENPFTDETLRVQLQSAPAQNYLSNAFLAKIGKHYLKKFQSFWSVVGNFALSHTTKTLETRNDLKQFEGGSTSVIYYQLLK